MAEDQSKIFDAIFISAKLDDYGLTADEFRVLCRIARRGDCTEGVKGMAEGCLLSERQVRYARRVLLACGFISEETRIGYTSILRCCVPAKWASPDAYKTIREEIRKGDTEKRPQHKEEEAETTPATDAGLHPMQGVLHTVQGGTAHGAAKGTPIKVLPKGNLEPNGSRRGKARKAAKAERPKNPFYEEFGKAFEARYEVPYGWKKGDYVQFAGLKDLYGEKFTLEEWVRACGNYFASPLGIHTCADLCVRYPAYRRSAQDRFKNPIEDNQNATSGFSQSNGNGRANGKPAPNGFKAPKPAPATGDEPELLEVPRSGLANAGGHRGEAVPMFAAQDYATSIGDGAEEIRQAEVIPITSAARFTPAPDSSYRFG